MYRKLRFTIHVLGDMYSAGLLLVFEVPEILSNVSVEWVIVRPATPCKTCQLCDDSALGNMKALRRNAAY